MFPPIVHEHAYDRYDSTWHPVYRADGSFAGAWQMLGPRRCACGKLKPFVMPTASEQIAAGLRYLRDRYADVPRAWRAFAGPES